MFRTSQLFNTPLLGLQLPAEANEPELLPAHVYTNALLAKRTTVVDDTAAQPFLAGMVYVTVVEPVSAIGGALITPMLLMLKPALLVVNEPPLAPVTVTALVAADGQ
jgi:hypothetical protein